MAEQDLPKTFSWMAPGGTPQQQAIAELWQQWLKERKFPDDAFSSAECHWAVTNFSMYLTDHFEEYKTLVSGGSAAMQLLAEYHGVYGPQGLTRKRLIEYTTQMEAVVRAYYKEHKARGCSCDICKQAELAWVSITHTGGDSAPQTPPPTPDAT